MASLPVLEEVRESFPFVQGTRSGPGIPSAPVMATFAQGHDVTWSLVCRLLVLAFHEGGHFQRSSLPPAHAQTRRNPRREGYPQAAPVDFSTDRSSLGYS
jgi:hypothetical protein